MTSTFQCSVNAEHILEVKGLHVIKGGNVILKDVNFAIKDYSRPGLTQGQIVTILGRSGIGKTQLFRCISGLQQANAGTIYLPIAKKVPVAGEVGVVLQNYPLMDHRTVLDNLKLVSSNKAKIDELLTAFGLERHSHLYPNRLSGGQRQRVSIIQQMLCSEHFMLMDEPFSGLDPLAKNNVCSLIKTVAAKDEQNTIIVITHDISAALSISDTIFMLGCDRAADGTVIPGAYVKHEFDLVDRDICWHEKPRQRPAFSSTYDEIYDCFERS